MMANIHLPIRPRSDLALINGFIHILIEHDLIDRDYIARATTGFEALRDSVRDYTPERVAELTGIPVEMIWKVAFAYARAGKKADAAHTFDALKKDANIYLPRYDEAKYYIGIGDKDHAFELLDQALAADSFHMTWLKVDPELDLLRDDPRFAQLVAKVGLPN